MTKITVKLSKVYDHYKINFTVFVTEFFSYAKRKRAQ